ncbi:glycoside hydrolase family 2 protein [Vibrio sp. JPW-9-11-11]|uniref:glycoside hydrolase family 2 protein n=1 Tax=Vibrio sp. JPW-9-11-11 TaxID=1416532 RepID=UPI0015931B52|nr:sugar-binding domain-containing protein [Vibrio sp. JPW-9-11-11]NVD06475.1 glycoside hydrolase family 2 protein [Vibrio sp. JPW-9-11-11]
MTTQIEQTSCRSQLIRHTPTLSLDCQREFSHSGFFSMPDASRRVFDFNGGWLFYKGDQSNANQRACDDKNWSLVTLPHCVDLLPEDASGTINYQGIVWYRKHFALPEELQSQRVVIDFEAIQGKSEVWINGKLVASRQEGFLPLVIDVTSFLDFTSNNVIAVKADNSDDPNYPAGKNQYELDFTYLGGIYRDVWLYSTNQIHFGHEGLATSAEFNSKNAGLRVRYHDITKQSAAITLDMQVVNQTNTAHPITLECALTSCQTGDTAVIHSAEALLETHDQTVTYHLHLDQPELWHPDTPNLYWLDCRIFDISGQQLDSTRLRIGIRSLELRGKEGLYINGEAYQEKLIGVNRHQYYAHIGTALSNSQHWSDVKKLKDAGLSVIRTAHYPQDPAFLDAADQLGVLVIQPSIGWQFWNDDPRFVAQAKQNVREKIRRDRNRACLWMFEPALNETHQPDWFLNELHQIVHQEMDDSTWVPLDSYIDCPQAREVMYAHPNQIQDGQTDNGQFHYPAELHVPVFTREWGDNVDDWNSHNSNSRVHRSWGEQAQIVQALHYAIGSDNSGHEYATNLNVLHQSPRQHIGGTMWHGFDHQRGYHPEQFWGGIMDAFRQDKYSYHVFMAQRNPNKTHPICQSGYHLKILHEATPISGSDIVVVANVDRIELSVAGQVVGTQVVKNPQVGIPFLPAIFKDAFDFMDFKRLHREEKFAQACIIAHGYVGEECVISEVKYPAKRPTRLRLRSFNASLVANGSDIATIIAEVTDEDGNVKRLARHQIKFEVYGEASLIDADNIFANPRATEWGSAPALIRTTQIAGKVLVVARPVNEGINTLVPALLELETRPNPYATLQCVSPTQSLHSAEQLTNIKRSFAEEVETRIARNTYIRAKLRGVELQQSDCGEFHF